MKRSIGNCLPTNPQIVNIQEPMSRCQSLSYWLQSSWLTIPYLHKGISTGRNVNNLQIEISLVWSTPQLHRSLKRRDRFINSGILYKIHHQGDDQLGSFDKHPVSCNASLSLIKFDWLLFKAVTDNYCWLCFWRVLIVKDNIDFVGI